MPRLTAASARMPPKHETSSRPPFAITATSPASATAISALAMCVPACDSDFGAAWIVRARPATTRPTGHSGRMPVDRAGQAERVERVRDGAGVERAEAAQDVGVGGRELRLGHGAPSSRTT